VPGARLRCAALGAAAGGAAALPLGALEAQALRSRGAAGAAGGPPAAEAYRRVHYPDTQRDGAAAVIAQLEASLADSPAVAPAPAPRARASAEAPAEAARGRGWRWWGGAAEQ